MQKKARLDNEKKKKDEKRFTYKYIKESLGIIISDKALKGIDISFSIVLGLLTAMLGFLSVLIYEGVKWMLSTWANLTMEELVYQIKAPIAGTNTDLIQDFLNKCLAPALVTLIFIIVVLLVIQRRKMTKWVIQTGVIITAIVVGVSSIEFVWEKLDGKDYMKARQTSSLFIEENYVSPKDVAITFPEQKRNLVYIYLESMEATYASKEMGGAYAENYIPELSAVAAGNVNFSNRENLGGLFTADGSTWTMGGLVSQTMGLPLRLNLRTENVEGEVEVLPRAVGLGDILNAEGYKQVIMFGSDGAFAGRQQFFEAHGEYVVKDHLYAIDAGLIPPGYAEWWGYEDQKLFSYAKQELEELSAGQEPFNFTMLTADTHFEDGYVCELCQNTYQNQYADVMACSSRQVAEFISWIQQQPFYENTTIVLVGDHLTMDSDFCSEIDGEYDRAVYNAFINAPVVPVNEKNRQATTMDMFPTTLAALGVEIEGNKLGLGTNLFSDATTLAEQVGMEKLNQDIRKNSLFYNALAGDEVVDDSVMDMN